TARSPTSMGSTSVAPGVGAALRRCSNRPSAQSPKPPPTSISPRPCRTSPVIIWANIGWRALPFWRCSREGSRNRTMNVNALSEQFRKYDQVEKAHTYRLAEDSADEFDEDYAIATLDFSRFLNGDAADKARLAD